ncbi:MAG TPA: SLC13 family permease [Actinophytocola sp.]|uniref:SLC13 family permease n=1 Tax=Actinophytocola sp. TaxID=1872138 RepID=UPI002F9444E4
MEVLAAVVVVATLAAMASGKVPAVLALATGLAAGGILGLAPVPALFAGLSNGGVITVASVLVIAKGVVKTGVVARATWRLLATVTTAAQALRRLVAPVGVASALMNTTPLVAMLIPAARQLQQTRNIPAREVLLPVAHATTLAGSVTLIGTSSNLLIAGIAADDGVRVDMLSVAPVALPVCLVGWVLLLLAAPRLLRGRAEGQPRPQPWRVEVPIASGAIAIGRRAADIGIERTQEYVLQAIIRHGEQVSTAEAFKAGDRLVFAASETGVRSLWESPRFGLWPQHLYMVSVGPGEHSTLLELEDDYVHVLAAETAKPLGDTTAVPGATVFATCSSTQELARHEALTLWAHVAGRAPQPGKTWTALGILTAVVVAASLGLAPVELIAFAGAVLMVLTRLLTPRSAVRALDWNVLFILAGSVGLGAIIVESGLAAVLARSIEQVASGSMVVVVVVFALTTAVMTNLVTNAAAASILTPVALDIATRLGVDPVTLLALVATCISFTFINPFSHQSNLMVMGPGAYSTRTFAKFGAPLMVVSLATASVVTWTLLGGGH